MAKGGKKKSAAAAKSAGSTAASGKRDISGKDAIALLKADHRAVQQLFRDYASAESSEEKERLVTRVCDELTIHALLEEELFYPACREHGVETELLDEAQVEHDGVKLLIAELQSHSPDEEYYDAKVMVLSKYVLDHIEAEEQRNEGTFAQAKQHGVDLKKLAQRLQERKSELMRQSEASRSRLVQVHSLDLRRTQQLQQETHMNRQSNERSRDERGRFESDDDDRSSRSGGRYSRERDDDEERSSSRSSRGYSSRAGREEEEEGNGRGRGWHGDSEGHSRASERGWEERGGGSRYSRGRDDEDEERYSSRGGGRAHGRGGWFGDSEGHSRASERAWEEGRRPGGWFGDSEGHSRAAERRWEEGGRSRSSRRDEDDEDERSSRGGGRGRGHGGWYGDSEGHSEAARNRSR